MNSRKVVAIFWDIDSCRVPEGTSASTIANCLRHLALQHGSIKAFHALTPGSTENTNIQGELKQAGINLIEASETRIGGGSARDISLVNELWDFAYEAKDQVRVHIILVGNNPGCGVTIGRLRNKGVEFTLVHADAGGEGTDFLRALAGEYIELSQLLSGYSKPRTSSGGDMQTLAIAIPSSNDRHTSPRNGSYSSSPDADLDDVSSNSPPLSPPSTSPRGTIGAEFLADPLRAELDSLAAVLESLRVDGFKPTFKVIMPRLGAMLGTRIDRARFERMLKNAQLHLGVQVDFALKTCYPSPERGGMYGGFDPSRASRAQFEGPILEAFARFLAEHIGRTFPNRFDMAQWVQAYGPDSVRTLKQGPVVTLCQLAINEKLVAPLVSDTPHTAGAGHAYPHGNSTGLIVVEPPGLAFGFVPITANARSRPFAGNATPPNSRTPTKDDASAFQRHPGPGMKYSGQLHPITPASGQFYPGQFHRRASESSVTGSLGGLGLGMGMGMSDSGSGDTLFGGMGGSGGSPASSMWQDFDSTYGSSSANNSFSDSFDTQDTSSHQDSFASPTHPAWDQPLHHIPQTFNQSPFSSFNSSPFLDKSGASAARSMQRLSNGNFNMGANIGVWAGTGRRASTSAITPIISSSMQPTLASTPEQYGL